MKFNDTKWVICCGGFSDIIAEVIMIFVSISCQMKNMYYFCDRIKQKIKMTQENSLVSGFFNFQNLEVGKVFLAHTS
jgi:hypothetical protein